MNVSPSKENILKKIRKALTTSTPLPFLQSEGNNSLFQPSQQENAIVFAEEFTRLQGKFVFCLDHTELAAQLAELVRHRGWTKLFCREEALAKITGLPAGETALASCDAAITSCEALVARTGTIVMSTATESGRTTSVYAPVHICIAYTHQLVYEVKDALQRIKEKYHGGGMPSFITFASGPSRTADIEKTLVVGVHGPKEVYVFLIDQ